MHEFNYSADAQNKSHLGARIRSHARVRAELSGLSQLRPWISLGTLALDWLLILGVIALSERVDAWWMYGIAVLVVASRQHALLVLMHDGAHFRLHTNAKVNDFVSDVFAAFPLLADTAGYRKHHQAHHRHLNSQKDPDWVRKSPLEEWQFPKSKEKFAVELLRNFYRAGIEWAQLAWYFSFRSRWIAKALLIISTAVLLTVTKRWDVFLMYWAVPLFLVFPWFQRLRSISEHFGLSLETELNQSRNVLSPWYEAWLFGPHSVNHHLTHHMFPSVPFYHLPELSRLLGEIEEFSATAHQNSSYLLPTGNSVLNDLVGTPGDDPAKKQVA